MISLILLSSAWTLGSCELDSIQLMQQTVVVDDQANFEMIQAPKQSESSEFSVVASSHPKLLTKNDGPTLKYPLIRADYLQDPANLFGFTSSSIDRHRSAAAPKSTVSFMTLTGISAKSVATLAATAGIGAYAKKVGVLTEPGEKALGKLITSIFLPSLIIQKLIPSMNAQSLGDVWPLAVMCVFGVLYGLVIGYCMGYRMPAQARGLLMVSVAFPNSFSAPLTLLLALGPLEQFGSPTEEHFSNQASALFLMSYSLWIFIRWTIGYPILTGALSFSEWREKVWNTPVKSCFLGVGIGLCWSCVPHGSQQAFLARHGNILDPLDDALTYAGQCSVPCILMTLGANLVDAVEEVLSKTPNEPLVSKEPPKDALPLWSYFAIVFFRQVLGPLIGASIGFGLLRHVLGVKDTVVIMVGLLQTAGPPMINLAVMAGMSEKGGQKTVAKILLFTYAFSIMSWTCAIAFFLFMMS